MEWNVRFWKSCLPLLLMLAPTAAFADPESIPAPDLKPGDTWVFDKTIERGTTGYSEQHLVLKLERVGSDTMVVGAKVEGSPREFEDHIVGADWSQHRVIDGNQATVGRPFSFPLNLGKTWRIHYVDATRHGLQASAEHEETYKVTGWSDITTPAGTFHAIKIEADDKVKAQFVAASGAIGGVLASGDSSTAVIHTDKSGPHTVYGEIFHEFYYVPDVKYFVKSTEEIFNGDNVRGQRTTDTLVSFKPAS